MTKQASTEPQRDILTLARKAESFGLDLVAFELFLAAERIESTGRRDAVRRELAETAELVSGVDARFYRRAARLLAAAPPAGAEPRELDARRIGTAS